MVALGEGVGHQRRDRGDIDLQRVDAQVGLPGVVRQPPHQRIQVQLVPRPLAILDLLRGEELQRVLLVLHRAAADRQALLGVILGDAALGDQLAQDVAQVERTVLGGRGKDGHADSLLQWRVDRPATSPGQLISKAPSTA